MATYKKLLKNRAGDTIIPVVDYPDPDIVDMSVYGGDTFRTTSGTSYLKFGDATATFAGGTYILDIRDIYVSYNSASYNAYYYISVDGGTKIQFCINTSFGGQNVNSRVVTGNITGLISLDIPAGSHTIELGMATNNANKTITIVGWDTAKVFAHRVWTSD